MLAMVQRSYTCTRSPLNQIVPHESSSRQRIERTQGGILCPGNNQDTGVMAAKCPSGNEWIQSLPSASMFKHIQSAALSVSF